MGKPSGRITGSTRTLSVEISTVAALPGSGTAAIADVMYATNGRKGAEGAGAGTGVLVFFDSSGTWIAVDSGTSVTA